VQRLSQVEVAEDGLGELRTALSAVATDVGDVIDVGRDALGAEVDQLRADASAIGDALDTAQQDPSAAALRTVRSTIATLVEDVESLTDDPRASC